MMTVVDRTHRYVAVFNPETGVSVRSGMIDERGHDTGKDPFQASFPELLDIGIMGRCAHGQSGRCLMSGVECYQSGDEKSQPNMALGDFVRIIDECRGRTFQVALGGRGDPDMHDDFLEIIGYARKQGVVPNFTTSGFALRQELMPAIKASCGAVAVSWYRSSYTLGAIEMLLAAGIKTNIHYCLSNATIDEAIERMRYHKFPAGINRIIFLLHKPVGRGSKANVLRNDDSRVKEFFSLFDDNEYIAKAGFDSCSVPGLLGYTSRIWPASIEPCEAGRFSAYISPDLSLYPCSFEQDPAYAVPLRGGSLEDAWNGEQFMRFRRKFVGRCPSCQRYEMCFGGCPVLPEVTLCDQQGL
ncbi:MAG: radical SAM protein [Selenomonadales bacterium]|jgi:radical SAM protein with 4Fe4S-binding SPASM domain|nr:radical SAM protein [Selenomonadales bacterium]